MCTSCIGGYYFLNAQCLLECPGGYYPEPGMMECLKCVYPCKHCSSRTHCLSCIEGLKFNGTCLMSDACPIGTYLLYDSLFGSICQGCSQQCEQCLDF